MVSLEHTGLLLVATGVAGAVGSIKFTGPGKVADEQPVETLSHIHI